MKKDKRAVHSRAILPSNDRATPSLSVHSLFCATSVRLTCRSVGGGSWVRAAAANTPPTPAKETTRRRLCSCAWREGYEAISRVRRPISICLCYVTFQNTK